jgi:hypothetical protein
MKNTFEIGPSGTPAGFLPQVQHSGTDTDGALSKVNNSDIFKFLRLITSQSPPVVFLLFPMDISRDSKRVFYILMENRKKCKERRHFCETLKMIAFSKKA